MENTKSGEAAVEVKVEAWSGNMLPWRATVYVGGKYVGQTGGCKTPSAAERAGLRIAAKYKSEVK